MQPLAPVSLDEVRAAAGRLGGVATHSPLLRLEGEAPAEIHLKLESLQPTGSFKVRGAGNALEHADPALLARGVATASAGNMARAAAWLARRRGVPCTVVAPDDAPAAKLDPVAALGARIVRVPFDAWWQALVDRGHPELDGFFIHPVSDPAVIAGNGTIGLEIVADLPEVDAVVVPFGGGGLSSGIACAVKALRRGVRVFAAEVATAAPLAASLAAGRPVEIDRAPSFVDGIGSGGVLTEMWPLVSSVLDGSIVVELEAVAEALRLLATRNRIVAEGAGAAALAAALTGQAGTGRVVAVISGGNIDTSTLAAILAHRLP
ncbi:MAG TPA: pyridoxal-phosphate dependent enzyme [Candidatus Limnocylindria bacterium]|jgi:threonine dehydratase